MKMLTKRSYLAFEAFKTAEAEALRLRNAVARRAASLADLLVAIGRTRKAWTDFQQTVELR